MITNTVIVFLRDLLPIFILVSYLSVFFEQAKLSRLYLFSVLAGSASLTLLLFLNAEIIADWQDGSGLEITFALLLCAFFLSFLYVTALFNKPKRAHKVAILIGMTSFVALKSAEFLIFFSVYGQQATSLQNMMIGCIVGLGICISFSALFRFLLSELKHSQYVWLFLLFWCAFLAGQFSQISSILSQVDLVSLGPPIFDTSKWIKDSSEYGHMLNALFGYESSPSLGFAITYIAAFIIAYSSQYLLNIKKLKLTRGQL